MAATRTALLVVLAPPLLAELAVRRLAACGRRVVVVAEDRPVPPGRYGIVVRNRPLPAGVAGDLVVDLPAADGSAPPRAAAGEVVALDRLDDLADLLGLRGPVDT